MPPTIHLVAAVARGNVIGRNNALPWHISADLRRFKALTQGHVVVMGRKTHDSIGKPLPHRRNVVVSRRADAPPGCDVVRSLADAIAAADGEENLYIIGGGEIYRQAIPLAHILHLTEIEQDVPDGDVFFPDYKSNGEWRETARETPTDNIPPYAFVTYQRVSGVGEAHRNGGDAGKMSSD